MRRWTTAATLALAISCTGEPGGPGGARTHIYLTDAPFPYDSIAAVNVYVARIDASSDADTSGGPNWVTVATPQRTFNLLDLQGGRTALLGEAELPAAQYAAVRVVINTSRSSVVRRNGSLAPVQWPVADELALYALVEQPLTIGTTGGDIVIDFDVGRSFARQAGGGPFVFIPAIRAVVASATGEIRGSVTYAPDTSLILWSVENIAIEVYREVSGHPIGFLAATGRTDATGHYVIPYLVQGEYRVEAYPPGYPWKRAAALVGVVPGQVSTMNLVIGPDSSGGGGGGNDPTGPVASVVLTPETQTAHVGDSLYVLATPSNAQGQVLPGRSVTWAVSDSTALETMWSGSGWVLFRAKRTASVTVTGTVEGKSGSATVVIQP